MSFFGIASTALIAEICRYVKNAPINEPSLRLNILIFLAPENLIVCVCDRYGYVPTEEEVNRGMINPYDAGVSECDGAYAGKLYRYTIFSPPHTMYMCTGESLRYSRRCGCLIDSSMILEEELHHVHFCERASQQPKLIAGINSTCELPTEYNICVCTHLSSLFSAQAFISLTTIILCMVVVWRCVISLREREMMVIYIGTHRY